MKSANGKGKKSSSRRNDGYSVYEHKASGLWAWAATIGYLPSGNPKRKTGYAKTRDEAVAAAQAIAIKHRNGGFVPTSKDSTVAEYLEAWLDLHVRPHLEPKTISFYETNVRVHIVPAFGKVKLRQLTSGHIQKLINEKTAAGKSASTVHGILRTLRTALTKAWREDLVEQNQAQKVSMPKLEQKRPSFFTPAQAKKLAEAVQNHPLRNLFLFTLATGVRVGEVTGLTWNVVDMPRRLASLEQQLQRVNGELILKRLKSRSSRRNLHLSQTAYDALQDQKSAQLINPAENPLNLVFLNHEGRPIDPKYLDEHLKAILKAAELPQLSFHKLRHTAATLAVAAGVELHQVKEMLGHSQIALTANLYAHALTDAQRKAADKLDQVLRDGKLPED